MTTTRTRRGGDAPTLEDVARRAGVSTATVSRALNAPDRVNTATRDRVMSAVSHLGYSPNFGARALAAKKTNTIGAIIPTMENAIFARGVQAFQEELRLAGVTLLIASSSYRPELEEEQIRTLIARGADALLLIGHDRDEAIYRFLETQKAPVLISWAYDPTAPQVSIGFDNRAAIAALTREVLRQGHRRIAMISAETAQNDRARERRAGVQATLREAGIGDAEFRVVETSYGVDTGAAAFQEVYHAPEPPTAVICGNDVLAVGALKRARELALKIPDDVSITGFDDIELASVVSPALTTVHVPHRQMGREAARMLVRMVNGWTPEESVRLDASVRMRETLGPPPVRG
ncbi:MAG: LacI family DNA-binding transcriptional regulator [Pseudomonadota bacterium]